MAEPFLTTVVGSLPKPAWLLEQISMNADGGKQVRSPKKLVRISVCVYRRKARS